MIWNIKEVSHYLKIDVKRLNIFFSSIFLNILSEQKHDRNLHILNVIGRLRSNRIKII